MIGRNTAFTYRGKHVDLKRIGRELNVRYVLEGSVQRAVTGCASVSNSSTPKAAIISGRSSSISLLADLFDMQDEIVSRLANALSAQLIAVEARRSERSPPPTRWTY